jgi:hypothetical protein
VVGRPVQSPSSFQIFMFSFGAGSLPCVPCLQVVPRRPCTISSFDIVLFYFIRTRPLRGRLSCYLRISPWTARVGCVYQRRWSRANQLLKNPSNTPVSRSDSTWPSSRVSSRCPKRTIAVSVVLLIPMPGATPRPHTYPSMSYDCQHVMHSNAAERGQISPSACLH